MNLPRSVGIALIIAVCAMPASAQAPGSFDGTWQFSGARTADPYCSLFIWRTLTINQGTISGTLGHFRGGFDITGQVTGDGKAAFYGTGPYGQLLRGSGEFSGGNARGSIRVNGPDQFCVMDWSAGRQP